MQKVLVDDESRPNDGHECDEIIIDGAEKRARTKRRELNSYEVELAIDGWLKRSPFLSIATERLNEDGLPLSIEEMKTAHAKKLLAQLLKADGREFSTNTSVVVGYVRNKLRTLDEFGLTTDGDTKIAQWFLKEGASIFAEIKDAEEEGIKNVDDFLAHVAKKVVQVYYVTQTTTKKEMVTKSLSSDAPAIFEDRTRTLSPETQLHNALRKNEFALLQRLKAMMNTLVKEFFIERELDGEFLDEDDPVDAEEADPNFERMDHKNINVQEMIKKWIDREKLKKRIESLFQRRTKKKRSDKTFSSRAFHGILPEEIGEELVLIMLREGMITEWIRFQDDSVQDDSQSQYDNLRKKEKRGKKQAIFLALDYPEGIDAYCNRTVALFEENNFGVTTMKSVETALQDVLSKNHFNAEKFAKYIPYATAKALLFYLHGEGCIQRYDIRKKITESRAFSSDDLFLPSDAMNKIHFRSVPESQENLLKAAHAFLTSNDLLFDEISE